IPRRTHARSSGDGCLMSAWLEIITEKMLDLSFLTEEEYEKLMKVLQRDAELKKKDSDRIRRLQGSLKDEKKKKFVTGEWFNEVKAKRFQEELEGPDLLRASIRKKKEKPESKYITVQSAGNQEKELRGRRVEGLRSTSISGPSGGRSCSKHKEGVGRRPWGSSPGSCSGHAAVTGNPIDNCNPQGPGLEPGVEGGPGFLPTPDQTQEELDCGFYQRRRSLRRSKSATCLISTNLALLPGQVSGSVLSVYSGDFGSVDAQGTVQFALDYDEKNREFQIYVSQCKDLAVVDEKKGRSDPYVKTYLLPDKARMGKRKTSVKKRTVNPIYSEVLRYKIEKMVLLIQKLNLSVWHNDPLGRNSFLGEIEIDLASWDWSNKKLNWYMLKPRVSTSPLVSYYIFLFSEMAGPKNPSSGEVHIWVKDSKDLPQLRPSGVDSFVKCYVLPDTSKKSYQKTRVIKRDPNPVFNHTIVYDGFHTEDLKDACVELTVWDHEKLTNHFLGGIRLGLGTGTSYGISVDWMDSTQEEVAFWQEMMAASNEWIEGSLPLRSLAGRRKLK
uniref:Synaptotagmin-like protein 2 n=1 Tax=Chelydra serpentina TaxID=8475 RepID=A0A8C3RYG1_CHESE